MKSKPASQQAHPSRRGATTPTTTLEVAKEMIVEARSAFAASVAAESKAVEASFIVQQFTDVLPAGSTFYVRKDVKVHVQSVTIHEDSVSVWLDLYCRGHHYVGELRHRVPVIPTPTRFGGRSSWVWGHDLRTIDRRPCPPAAADLARADIERKYREAFDESDPDTVEVLLDEVMQAHALESGLAAYRDVVAMLDGVLKALGRA